MARTWQYTRWRYLGMQGVMWLVLGAAVGLAALTDRSLRQSQTVGLGPPITDGPVTYRLPANWQIGSGDIFGAMAHRAVDPDDDTGRKITVILQQVDHWMPPLIYLQRTDQLPEGSGNVILTPYLLKGLPAQLARWTTATAGGQSKSVIACCVMLPSRQALTIRLERDDVLQPSDPQLIQQVLNSVTVSGPAVTSATTVQLTGGVQITPAADFVVYPEPDPLRTDRFLVRKTAEGGWISAQCLPMLMGNLPAASLRGALIAVDPLDPRDPAPTANWLAAEVQQVDNKHWKIDPHDPAEGWLHRRAYVTAGDGGQGVLILLTAQSPATDADLDQAYADLQMALPAGATLMNADTLLAAGTMGLPAASAYTPHAPPAQQWWLWLRQGATEGSTHSYIDSTGQLPVRETLRRDWQGLVYHVSQRWGLGQSAAGVWAETARYDPPDQATFVADTRSSDRTTTTIQFNGQDTQAPVPLSPAMVSGARFPEWLPGLGGAPAAFWTDHFPGYEAEPFPSPVLLILRPLPLAGKERAVEAEINGTGQLSRWYFAPDGTFLQADFCGGVSLQPATEEEVDSATQKDPRLTPSHQQPTIDSGSPQ